MNKSEFSSERFDDNDNNASVISTSLISTVSPSKKNPKSMETYPILNDQDDVNYSGNVDGYLRLHNRPSTQFTDIENLKYPRNMDPYKIIKEIVVTIVICVLALILFGISFLFTKCESFVIFEGVCGLMFLSCVVLFFFYAQSVSWAKSLINAGFYKFPGIIGKNRVVVIFVWTAGIFFFCPAMLAAMQFCKPNTTGNLSKSNTFPLSICNHTNTAKCWLGLDIFHLMQLYLSIETLLVLIALINYLIPVIRFRRLRQWPDIWHERLLEESSLIEWCPLLTTSELRISNTGSSVSVTMTDGKTPSEKDIMKIQAYVIKYLRNLNDQLATKIFKLNQVNHTPFNENYSSVPVFDSRENHFNESAVSSVNSRVPDKTVKC